MAPAVVAAARRDPTGRAPGRPSGTAPASVRPVAAGRRWPGFGGGSVDQATLDYLVANRGSATWLVATMSAGAGGSIELATGQPVMAMGGFSGSDPTPTLAELQAYIASGQLRFVILGGGGGPGGRNDGVAAERNAWIVANCPVVEIGGSSTATVYDCQGTVS